MKKLATPTMSDIAEICGVTRQTVYAALNDKPGVSEETRQRILSAVKEHNYRPNRIALTLKNKSTNMVGVTIFDIRNTFFADWVQGINRVLRKHGLHLMVFEVADKEEEIDAIETIIDYQVCGMILCPVHAPGGTDVMNDVNQRGIPLVSLGPVEGLEYPIISVQNVEVGLKATDHLVELGHRRLVCFRGPDTNYDAGDRAQGFVKSLNKHGIQYKPEMMIKAGDTIEEGYRCALEILRMPRAERPTGILCFNDALAMGVYEAIRELGMSIPDDMSVVGCDDVRLARLLGPPLSTMAVPVQEMGEAAAELLIAQIESKDSFDSHARVFKPKLVSRGSVLDLRHASPTD